MTGETGVLVCGHGSRDADAIREFEAVAAGLRTRLPEYPVEHAFLEFATPVIRTGLDALHARGVRHVLAVTGMLFAAGHAKNDIPSVLTTYQAQHPDISIHYGRKHEVGLTMLRADGDRGGDALNAAGRAET